MKLRNITKDFQGEFLLDSVNLDLRKHEVHVLVGENGSGKSALMQVLTGIIPRDSGEILLYGKPVNFSSLTDAMKAGISYQHQDLTLFENLSIAENIYFEAALPQLSLFCRFDRKSKESRCAELLQEFGIDLDPRALVGTLGYTERQLLSAIRIYITDPKIVIFDEPTASMNEHERNIFFSVLERLKQRTDGIFYISHRLDEIKSIGDRISVMHHGSLIHSRRSSDVSPKTLFHMMSGTIDRDRYPRITMKPGKEVLAVKNLKHSYALKDVSFSLRKQEILGITGLMGSGRTILANCLFGVFQPTDGQIIVRGSPVQMEHPSDALNQGICLIPENRVKNAMFPHHDLVQNMTISSLKRFEKHSVIDNGIRMQIVKDYVKRLHIKPGESHDLLHTYSGGNQQKVMVARWFMSRCSIYIMDEPTRGVDVSSRIDIYNSMNDLIAKGASLILISSDIEEILGMSDRILVLAGGRIVCDIPRSRATKQLILSYASRED